MADDPFLQESLSQDEDELEALYSESDLDDDPGTDPEARFRAAIRDMRHSQRDFSKPELLYDFLYKFRDVMSQVDDDLGTILHAAVGLVIDQPDVRSANMMPFIQSVLKEHPHLLTIRDPEYKTPLYMAIWARKPVLIEAMFKGCSEYPEWQAEVQLAIEMRCDREQNKTCFHLALERNIRGKTLGGLMKFARDKAFAIQDTNGKTPLHYAVQTSRPVPKLMRLFIWRDSKMLRTQKLENMVETFLDIVDDKGNSIYTHHLEFQARQRAKLKERDRKKGKVIEVRRVSSPEGEIEKSDGEPEPTGANMEMKRAPTNIPREVKDAESKGDTEKTEQQDQAERIESMLDRWTEIMDSFKLHYMRTRNAMMVESFLYGKNLNDIQFFFDYHGLPSTITDRDFEKSFEALKFDEILQYVSFPDVKVESTGRRLALRETQNRGQGRQDMEFLFNWLRKKGVRHIIKVQVEDSKESPHSDQSILSSLEGMQVERLDWGKVDLDPQLICRVGGNTASQTVGQDARNYDSHRTSQLNEVTLHWSGTNAVLRAWSEPEGLPMLPSLTKIIIHVPPADQMAESPEWVAAYLGEFRRRIARNVFTRVEVVAGTAKDYDIDEQPELRNIEIVIFQSQGRSQNWKSLNPGEQTRAPEEARAGQRWLDSVYKLTRAVESLWPDSLQRFISRQEPSTAEVSVTRDVVIALIDDGVDTYGSTISGNIIGGKSFSYDNDNHRVSPYWISQSGHGTVTADSILRICPMAKLYPLRLKYDSEGIELRSVALAIQAAIDQQATIIFMPWSIKVLKTSDEDKRSLEAVLQRACDRQILMFCASADRGPGEDTYPAAFRRDHFFQIGAARDDGRAALWSGPLNNIDFNFPGSEVILRHDIDSSRRSVDHIESYSGSSIATALGTGLAALILYCSKIAWIELMEQNKGDPEDSDEAVLPLHPGSLEEHHVMRNVLQKLGTLTDDKFLKVWETLDPVTRGTKNGSLPDHELLERLTRLYQNLSSKAGEAYIDIL